MERGAATSTIWSGPNVRTSPSAERPAIEARGLRKTDAGVDVVDGVSMILLLRRL